MPPEFGREHVPAGGRFTAYLPAERLLLQERAKAEGCSENYLLRIGVRLLLGLSVPARFQAEVQENLASGPHDRAPSGQAVA
jgi:hypothetical protein